MRDNPMTKNIIERINNREFKSKEELQDLITAIKMDSKYGNAIDEITEDKLLALYDKTSSIEETPSFGTATNYDNVISDLEKKIYNNTFSDKKALSTYITKLKNSGVPNEILTEEKVKELLNLYDTLNPQKQDALDLANYKGAKLEEKNVIVSTEDDVILKTDRSSSEMPQEFKENQNELTSLGNDGLANADEAFDHMRDKKEELNIISINEAINRDNIDREVLNKIRFFITNKYINPYSYKVDPAQAIFYNIETQEVLEVRKNEETGEYKIYRGGEQVYADDTPENTENELTTDKDEEELAYDKKNNKVKRLIKPEDNTLNNSAFIQGGLLFAICLILSILLAITLFIYQ